MGMFLQNYTLSKLFQNTLLSIIGPLGSAESLGHPSLYHRIADVYCLPLGYVHFLEFFSSRVQHFGVSSGLTGKETTKVIHHAYFIRLSVFQFS